MGISENEAQSTDIMALLEKTKDRLHQKDVKADVTTSQPKKQNVTE